MVETFINFFLLLVIVLRCTLHIRRQLLFIRPLLLRLASFLLRFIFALSFLDESVPVISPIAGVMLIENSRLLYGFRSEDTLEFHEIVPFLLESVLHFIQVIFDVLVFVGFAHSLLEKPRLQGRSRRS